MENALVTCENLVKIYKVADLEVVALQGLYLEVAPGEMVALVGASGSGKTTLLNMLGALDVPSAGRCIVSGNDLTRINEAQRTNYRCFTTGHVWQQAGRNLLPELSVAENITLPQMLGGTSGGARARRTRELMERSGIAHLARKKPQQISGGEQQRAAIAVALANAPVLLLADEPTGELDSTTAGEILTLLRELNRELGLTILIVTHDVAVASVADRTIAIRDGRTNTETVRREAPLAASGDSAGASAVIGLPGETHRESVLIDRVGGLQLPHEALLRIPFNGRADVRILDDHVEIWPTERAEAPPLAIDPTGAALAPSYVARTQEEA
jgi:ABC-type lipoprotein export system ATPase subunit